MSIVMGRCFGCGNKSEVHEGTDQRPYCEDCLVRLKKDPESQHLRDKDAEIKAKVRNEDLDVDPTKKVCTPEISSTASKYLDYIIRNANDRWLNKFLRDYVKRLKESYEWITILENTPNDLVLLRLAVELGYGQPTKSLKQGIDLSQSKIDLGDMDGKNSGKKEPASPAKSRVSKKTA